MKLAESSQYKLEIFFQEIFSDENFRLPTVNFYAGKFSRIFTSILQVHGITFGRHIFIMPDLIERDFESRKKLSLELVAHEIVHVLQYKKDGFIKFFYKYLLSYWQNLRRKNDWKLKSRHEAYLEIPFEIEARDIAAKFVKWNRNGKFTA
jgi:Domain of unknown function (DUF4157)